MRRAFVVIVLLAMMIGLKALKAEAPGGSDPLTLAAIGFVLLAAFAIAELGSKLALPKVTGYIVTGMVLGPYAISVLSSNVVVEMKMFSTLALGLIATTAGVELDLGSLRAIAKTLSVTTLVKILGAALVFCAILAGETAMQILDLGSQTELVALTLVIATLSIGTSPSISLAVLTETRAKGRLTDLVLGSAVVKDIVLVMLLAIAIASARALLAGGAVDGAVLVHVAEELGASVLAGVVLGGALILYLRYVKAEMLLFVTAMILVVSELSVALRLDLLLVFIVAGFVVRNASSYGPDLLHPLETIALPVFIVFFTNAGASVDLGTMATVLPLALIACGARAVGFVIAGRVGGRVGGETEVIRRVAWLAYLPQAGVTLGLLGLAATQIPELATHITALGLTVVGVNLIVGPITLRFALRVADEIPSEGAPEAADADDLTIPPGASWVGIETPALQQIVRDVDVSTREAVRRFVATKVEPWVDERVTRLVEGLRTAEDREAALTEIVDAMERLPADDAPARVEAMLDLFAERVQALESIPTRLHVPLEVRWRHVAASDSLSARWKKRLAAIADLLRLRIRTRTRAVPARLAARTVIEPALARALEEAANGWYRTEALLFEELRRCALGTRGAVETAEILPRLSHEFVEATRADLVGATERASRGLAIELLRVGSPVYSASRIRYSKVEPALVRWRERVREDAQAWALRRDAASRLVRVTSEIALVEQRVGDQLRDQVLAVAEEAFATMREELDAQRRRLGGAIERARGAAALDEETLSRLQMEVAALVPRPVHKKLRTTSARLRRATSGGTVATIFRDATVEQAGREAIVHSIAALVDAPRPARAEVITLDIGETIQGYLSAELEPEIETTLGEIWTAFAAEREAMSNCESAAAFVLSSATREGVEEPPTAAQIAEQLEHAGATLDPVAEAAVAQWESLRDRLLASLRGIDEHLVEAIASAAGRSTAITQTRGRRHRFTAALLGLWAQLREPLGEGFSTIVARARGEAEHGIGRQYRLRSGAERADAADIREFLRRQDASATSGLPPMYRALFAADAVRDPRLFVAHRESLQEVVRAERAWQQDSTLGNAVLVIGGSGTGKTSLMLVARLKLATRRVIVVPERDRVEETTLTMYLARELGCEPELGAISVALGRARTAIVVDDLQTWLDLGPAGVAKLDALLSMMVSTRTSAFWLLAISRAALEAFESLLPVRPAFAKVAELESVDAADLDAIIESRQQLSGLAVTFPIGLRARALDRLVRRSPRASYLHALAAASQGNLRRALRAWVQRAQLQSERMIALRPIGVQWGLSFLRQLSAAQLATLALLLRFGKRRTSEIAGALAIADEHVARELRFLVAAGLVHEHAPWVEVPVSVRDEIAAALAEFGALPGGTS